MVAAMSPTGRTADGTWQFGVRRTIPLDPAGAWARLDALLERDDAVGETRSETPGVVRRLTYQMPGWPAPATLQLRVMPTATGSTLAVHLEQLPDAAARDAMRDRWKDALEGLAEVRPSR